MNKLYSCQYYEVFKADVDGGMKFEQKYPFLSVSVLDGSGDINGQQVKKGEHLILPFGYGTVSVSGQMSIIASTVH